MSYAKQKNSEPQLTDHVQSSYYSLPNYSSMKEDRNKTTSDSVSFEAEQDDICYTPTSGSLTLKSSILRSKSKFQKKNRKDSYGVIITPEIKQHKIKFKETVKEVKVVDNWKEYNLIEERPCCICNII